MLRLGAFWPVAFLALALAPAAARAAQPIEALGQQARLTQVLPDGEANLDAEAPAVAYNPEKDEFLAVWHSSVPPATNRREIFGQILDGAGNPKGAPVQLTNHSATDSVRWATDPDVAYLASVNRYVVAYRAQLPAPSVGELEVFARLVDDTGTTFGEPVQISTTTAEFPNSGGQVLFPAVATDGAATNERVIFTWSSDWFNGQVEYDVLGAIRNADLGSVVGQTRISDNPFSNNWTQTSVVYVPSADRFAVAWITGATGFGDLEVFVELTNLTTTTVQQTPVSDVAGSGGGAFAASPRIALRRGGGAEELMVAFSKQVPKPGTTDVVPQPFVQRLAPGSLLEIGEETQIGAVAQGIPTDLFGHTLELSYDPVPDRYLVTWAAAATAGKAERYGQALSGTGEQIAVDDFRISTTQPATDDDFDAQSGALALNTTSHQWLHLWEADDQTFSVDDELEIYRRLVGENTDRDFDGSHIPADCNDADPNIKPGANDVFDNGIDEDCSGADAENPDRDGDGSPRPADCNDANPAIKPGARDIAGNGVDEDCSGADTPELTRAALDRSFALFPTYATIRRLVVTRAKPGMRIEVSCRGRGCPKAVRGKKRRSVAVRKAGRVVLTKLFRGARLRTGARLEVVIIEPGAIGKADAFTFRSRARAPKRVSRCLTPGTTRTTRCPA